MRHPLSISLWLLALAATALAQNSNPDNLADIARQSRTHSSAAKKTWDDQNGDFGRSAEDSATACGAPIEGLQDGLVSELLGKDMVDPDMSKALLRWLQKHPDLDTMHPDDIARSNFPRTPAQNQANQATARAVAARWVSESQTPIASDSTEGSAAPAAVVNTTYTTTAHMTLAQAVKEEQQRRVRSDGSAADRVQEAVNLYSICESRRQVQFESEVDQLAKQEFQRRMTSTGPEVAQGK